MSLQEPTFEDLRCRYGTGRAYTISGSGRDRVMGYRNGIMCKLGDIEESEWMQMMRDLIERSGETQLHEQLVTWEKETHPVHRSKAELEREVMIMHAYRLFDDEGWVDFIAFNKRFRPDVLQSARLVLIQCSCCQTPGYTTQGLLDRACNGTTPCPVCGRWAEYQIMKTKEMEDAQL